MAPVKGNRTPIDTMFDRFDPRGGPGCEKRQHTVPVIGRAETKAEEVLIFRKDSCLPREPTDLSRGSMIDLADARVESSYATESRSQGDLSHRQPGFIDERFRKVQTAGVSHRTGRRTQVSEEEAAKMARANSQPLCKNFHSTVLKSALIDQPQSSRNCV